MQIITPFADRWDKAPPKSGMPFFDVKIPPFLAGSREYFKNPTLFNFNRDKNCIKVPDCQQGGKIVVIVMPGQSKSAISLCQM